MQRTTWKQIGLSAVAAMLAVGCASGAPQRAPGGAGNTVQGSTTGDLDACAVALGNATTAAGTTGTTGTTGMATGFGGGTTGTHTIRANTGTAGTTTVPPGTAGTTGATVPPGTAGTTGTTGGRMEVTANGLMVGNVAIVALPEHDHMPMSPTTGGGGGAAGTTGTTGTPAPGPGTTGTTGTTTGSPVGATGSPAGAPATGTAPNPTALDRIRSACRGVTEIRTVTDSADRAKLASITLAMRKGTPVTEYMTDIARIGRKATIASGTGGAGGGGTTPAPAQGGATPGSVTPGPTGTPAAP